MVPAPALSSQVRPPDCPGLTLSSSYSVTVCPASPSGLTHQQLGGTELAELEEVTENQVMERVEELMEKNQEEEIEDEEQGGVWKRKRRSLEEEKGQGCSVVVAQWNSSREDVGFLPGVEVQVLQQSHHLFSRHTCCLDLRAVPLHLLHHQCPASCRAR